MDFISCILQFPEYAIEFQPYLLASDETVRREFGAYDNIRDFLLAEEWN